MQIEGKISFKESNYYVLNYDGELNSSLQPGKEIKTGMLVSQFPHDKKFINVEYSGNLLVAEGQKIKEGEILSKQGKLIKKALTAPVSGTIHNIHEDRHEIEIEVEDGNEEVRNKFKPTFAPFDSKIHDVVDHKIVLEFPAVNINLFEVKGQDALGSLRYVPSNILMDKKKIPDNLDRAILITDTITSELYPHLSAMGVSALIANHIEHDVYAELVTFLMPVGIISGYGKLNEDDKLIKYLSSREGHPALVDTLYKRILIFDDKEASWLSNYKFDLERTGIIS